VQCKRFDSEPPKRWSKPSPKPPAWYALTGRLHDAARIIGFADAVRARTGAIQETHWTRVGDRLEPMLRAAFSPDELARLRAEGAAMREDQAVKLALGDAALLPAPAAGARATA